MKNIITYTLLALLAFASAVFLYRRMADEPILPTIEKTNLSPEYQYPYDKG